MGELMDDLVEGEITEEEHGEERSGQVKVVSKHQVGVEEGNGAEARRFAWLIDVLYDNQVKLVASFAVVPEALYEAEHTDSRRITSRLAEMQTQRYLLGVKWTHG